MNSVIEKEKKLTLALTKLKKLNLKNPNLQNSVDNLSTKKNQLEIEKKQIEEVQKQNRARFDQKNGALQR